MKTVLIITLMLVNLVIFGCREDDLIDDSTEKDPIEETGEVAIDTPDWGEQTHTKVNPNYAAVFKQDQVIRMDLKIDATSWAAMENDLADNLGSAGGNTGGPGGGGPGMGGPGGGGGAGLTSFDPIWAPCSIVYNGTEWYKVGVRFKGNSSLSSAYGMGIGKLSFKLDFDEFEDTYPAIKNQRFYGFKQLNLKNNYADPSFVREKVAADLFREYGLASSQTTFCEVYVDNGSGPEYFGLYTLVEEVDDTVLDSQYADGSGNLYKPDGTAATFASGSYSDAEMEKKTNEDEADYTDVKALYEVINSSKRTTASQEWQADLEKVFDVPVFLQWLAANTIMQNWDTYGRMTHNYYMYNNPETGKLNWMPWDANEAFQDGKQGGALSLDMSEVGSDWPLIRYILDVPAYKEQYQDCLKDFTEQVFTPTKLEALYSGYYTLLKGSAYAERNDYSFLNSDTDFDTAIATLKSQVNQRNTAVQSYLATK